MADSSRNNYSDIINLPYEKSVRHPHMTLTNRAAQFSPFAALTGYGDVIDETARLVDKKIEMTEEEKEELDRKLSVLLNETPGAKTSGEITVTYFVQDLYKEGGRYEIHTGILKKIDTFRRLLIFEDGTEISFDDISDLQNNTKQISKGYPI